MKKKIFVFAASLLMSFGASAAQQSLRVEPLRSRVNRVVSVPLDLQSGMPVVEVLIDGKGPYRFALDTGVKYSLIVDRNLAKQLALRHRGSERIVDVDCISLGDARFSALYAVVDDV